MQLNTINQIRQSRYLSLVLRIIVGSIFFYTGFIKIHNPGEFALMIQNYQMVPVILTNLLAILIPWLEIYTGLFIFLGLFSRASALTLSFLTSIFVIALLSALFRGLDIDCGCYGSGSEIDFSKILADIILLLFCLHLVVYPSVLFSLDRLFKRLP
jgi:uncharacterized membrane protein YphA (DoxX/SURF4 family)